MITKIRTATEYEQVMQIIEGYLQKATAGGGFQALSPAEADELQQLSLLAESWEDSIPLMPVSAPQTLSEMISLRMYQMKLKQKDVAVLLDVSPSRLSEVLKGKRKINLDFARRLHTHLNIDAAFILKTA
ncbi:MAG: helix-turn-helix domain-containing protein [Saprospiraceae bacterium]|nr:helix-turn-helix domain-containing protein [Saprospiraceae bacterium]